MNVITKSDDRLTVLMRFIRSQANLTNSNPPQIGPGDVHLNHEEALLCAAALEVELNYRSSLARANVELRDLLDFATGEWADWSEDVAMGGGTGTGALERLAADPILQRSCKEADRWKAIVAILREKIEQPAPAVAR